LLKLDIGLIEVNYHIKINMVGFVMIIYNIEIVNNFYLVVY
jgi:hypothetical protein